MYLFISHSVHADQIAVLSWENKPWYPLSRRLGGAQRQSGCFGEEKNLLPVLETNPRSSLSLVTVRTMLSQQLDCATEVVY